MIVFLVILWYTKKKLNHERRIAMSKVRENFIKAIELLLYDIDEELKHQNTFLY